MSTGSLTQGAGERTKPLISIVIPVYDIESCLTQCLDSITEQIFRDIEIIAVDGASDDGSGKLLDERAGRELRLKVIHTNETGPGKARNRGVEEAIGEYIWFVDGDDIMPTGCLGAIADHIKVTRPDVLFIDYEAFYPDGKKEPGHGHDLMSRQTAECFTLAEQPWVVSLSMASWNKIIRREFFLAASATFPPESPHEDVPVSCLLMLKAGRLSMLNRVCYSYRRGRPGSYMTADRKGLAVGASRRQFNIFTSYEKVLDDIKERAKEDKSITEGVRHAFFERAIWHYTSILDDAKLGVGPFGGIGLIARRDRREFFAKIHRDYLSYAPTDYKEPSGLRGVKFWLIKKNAYWTYSLLDPANKVRVRMDHGARRLLRWVRQAGQRLE
jgi:CDP-glycerol glycerophosphotransferase